VTAPSRGTQSFHPQSLQMYDAAAVTCSCPRDLPIGWRCCGPGIVLTGSVLNGRRREAQGTVGMPTILIVAVSD